MADDTVTHIMSDETGQDIVEALSVSPSDEMSDYIAATNSMNTYVEGQIDDAIGEMLNDSY